MFGVSSSERHAEKSLQGGHRDEGRCAADRLKQSGVFRRASSASAAILRCFSAKCSRWGLCRMYEVIRKTFDERDFFGPQPVPVGNNLTGFASIEGSRVANRLNSLGSVSARHQFVDEGRSVPAVPVDSCRICRRAYGRTIEILPAPYSAASVRWVLAMPGSGGGISAARRLTGMAVKIFSVKGRSLRA